MTVHRYSVVYTALEPVVLQLSIKTSPAASRARDVSPQGQQQEDDMSTTVQVDVTNWPNPLRIELLELIDKLTAQAAAGSETAEQSVQIKDDVVTTGWTYDAYFEVMSRLLKRHFVQAAAI